MTIRKIYETPVAAPIEKVIIDYKTPDGDQEFIINVYNDWYSIGKDENESFTKNMIPELIEVLSGIYRGVTL